MLASGSLFKGAQITYSLGHANTGIADGEGLVLLVGDDVDTEILAGVQLGLGSERAS